MWQSALDHFEKHDPTLFSFAQTLDPIVLADSFDPEQFFADLCNSIVGQQLSVKAGDTIWRRVSELFHNTITPQTILITPDEAIRATGTSWSKIRFMKDLAQHVQDKKLDLLTLHEKSNEEIIVQLTQVKGIGPWTAEMFLMFTLGRPDVFSLGDLGLKRGIEKIYQLDHEPSKQELLAYSEKWSPFRTYASRVLWRSLDNEPKL